MPRDTPDFDGNEELVRLVMARTEATEIDILAGRMPVVNAVAELASAHRGENGLRCEVDEAAALVRASVLGGVAWVGSRIAGVVNLAIYEYVLPLAEGDLADAERNRKETADEARIGRALG